MPLGQATAVAQKSHGASFSSNKDLLPLVPEDPEELSTSNSLKFTLRSVPGDNDSPQYSVYIRTLMGTEDVRTLILWFRDCKRVLHGLNVNAFAEMKPIIDPMLQGTTGSIFAGHLADLKRERFEQRVMDAADDAAAQLIHNTGVDHADNVADAQIEEGMKRMLRTLMPRKVLARAKRYMRRECRKPNDMKVKTYLQHLLRMNNQELPMLPPFREANKLAPDELIDILLFATPKSWQKEMERQGFDPMDDKEITDIVDFMENVESAENFDGTKVDNKKPAATSGSKKRKDRSDNGNGNSNLNRSGGSKYCLVHGHCSHTSDDCKALKAEAKRLKTSRESGDKVSLKDKSKNKTWKRSDDASKKDDKKDNNSFDLAAFVEKQVKEQVKKAIAKNASDDDDESGDLPAFNLQGFSYEDMENLKIEDDEASC